MRLPPLLLLPALLALLARTPAGANPLDVVNGIRAMGCEGGQARSVPLKAIARLDQVARINASGLKLADALKQVGYVSARSTSIYVNGMAQRESALARILRERFCGYVTDPGYREFGSATEGTDIWIVLARPFAGPPIATAGQVNERMLRLVNEARAAARPCGSKEFAAVAPVRLSAILNHAALLHAQDMASHGRISHAGSDGSNVAQRATRAGYQWRTVAENVASGQETPEAAMQAWLTSPGHCANLMSADFTEMGVAYAENAQSESAVFWAQVLARPR
jgi:uncharacterized protein YkwD